MPVAWQNDLTPIGSADWNYDFAAHLLERAGFGGTPEDIQVFAKLTPAQAVARLVHFEGTDASKLPPFDHSGIHDPGLFGCTLASEYDLARSEFGFTEDELAGLARNSLRYAFD